jgi:UDP-glucose:(heptosyl)LPS alpha-1,3-glucosyltransferase
MRLNARRSALLRAEDALLTRGDGPRLMVFSEGLRGRIERDFGRRREILVERPGVDTGRFHPDPATAAAAASEGRLRLLFVGHNFELKGLGPLLAALAIHRARGGRASLTVVGAGPIGRFRRAAARRGLSDAVAFDAAISREAMPGVYRRHDALIHPTFYDPFSLVVPEALASGIPVVTTRRNGASEIVEDGRQGYLLDDPRDESALGEALDRLSVGATRRAMGGEAALLGRRFAAREHFARVMTWLGGFSVPPAAK